MIFRLGYDPGCIDRIAEMHANYCARTVEFDVSFEAKVAMELVEFRLRYVDGRDGLSLAREALSAGPAAAGRRPR